MSVGSRNAWKDKLIEYVCLRSRLILGVCYFSQGFSQFVPRAQFIRHLISDALLIEFTKDSNCKLIHVKVFSRISDI